MSRPAPRAGSFCAGGGTSARAIVGTLLRMTTASAPVLSQRALNRALLERQLLLERAELSVPDAVAHLAGVQAQVPGAPYLGLWSRVAGFDPHDLGRRIAEMSLVRLAVQRATVHLHTVEDALAWRPLVQPTHDQALRNGFRADLECLDLAQVAAEGTRLLLERPRPLAEVGRELALRYPGRNPAALGAAVAYATPVLQLPPRGVWGESGKALLAPVEHALGRRLHDAPSADGLVLRYLRAFGPSSTSDIRTFTGLTGVRDVVKRLDLRRFADERGRELLDVPDGLLPDPDTPAPPRFLGEFDNVLLGHDDRTRVLATEHRRKVLLLPVRPLLVDGFAAGIWTSGPAGIVVRAFAPIADEAAVVAEGKRMLAALWPEAEQTVRIEPH